MSPVAALLVLVEQGSARRRIREIFEGCARGYAERPYMVQRPERPPDG